MSYVSADWSVTKSNGNWRYIGDDHGGAAPSYATVIEGHRALQDLADQAVHSGDDEVDITTLNPSARSTDNIITLLNNHNLDDPSAEHLFDGSIIQNSGDDIYDGIVNFGNLTVQIQVHQNGAVLADDWWNKGGDGPTAGGTHTGAADQAVLTDSGQTWTVNEWVGYTIYNTTDGSQAIITANTATTITGILYGGTEDDWDNSDAYLIGEGLNADAAAGISHRFMIPVRSGGTDIDGRRLLGTSRRFGNTFSEFSINGTSRGNNVLALSDTADLNNTTAHATVATWTAGITNTEGYQGIDVDNDTINEFYYSQWNANTPTRSINEFYENMKLRTAQGSAETLYALNGELFRGITHQIDVDGQGATDWSAVEAISWAGGTGQMLAVDDLNASTTIWFQLLTGVVPSDNDTITGGTSTATADAELTGGAIVARAISAPFIGASTGSALIGGYGAGIETNDLTNNDKLVALDNVTYTPPNNVTFSVTGLVIGEDRVLVGPWDGVAVDGEGNPAIEKDQMTLNTDLVGAAETVVNVTASIPTDSPAAGTIRVTLDDGRERLQAYTSFSGANFAIASSDYTDPDDATGAKNVWISYLDKLATATTESFSVVYNSDRDLVVLVRDGGGSPIKEFITSAIIGINGGTVGTIRTSDT